MKLVAPDYLSYSTLPFASDIFYHGKITYSLPTGFTPKELNAINEFPGYCLQKQIPQPMIIWDYCQAYFINSYEAYECTKILSPLREYVSFTQFIYPRDITKINESLSAISDNNQLYLNFQSAYNNIPFIAREFLSHLLFEVVIESGLGGACDYLQKHIGKTDKFFQLVAATMINRFKNLKNDKLEYLIYNHEWLPLLISCGFFNKPDPNASTINADIEFFKYKLFESIISPIFGRCDSELNSERIAKTAMTKKNEISRTKDLCYDIALDVMMLDKKDSGVAEKALRYRIQKDIITPLSDLLEVPKSNISTYVVSFLRDSTLIAGLISSIFGFNSKTFVTSVAASAISTGTRILEDSIVKNKNLPSKLLLEGLKHSSKHFIEYSIELERIGIVKYPL